MHDIRNITVNSCWYGNITIDVPKGDTFALEAIAHFKLPSEDIGYAIRIPVITPRAAREFIDYCA